MSDIKAPILPKGSCVYKLETEHTFPLTLIRSQLQMEKRKIRRNTYKNEESNKNSH